jgi:hypothetical protein
MNFGISSDSLLLYRMIDYHSHTTRKTSCKIAMTQRRRLTSILYRLQLEAMNLEEKRYLYRSRKHGLSEDVMISAVPVTRQQARPPPDIKFYDSIHNPGPPGFQQQFSLLSLPLKFFFPPS